MQCEDIRKGNHRCDPSKHYSRYIKIRNIVENNAISQEISGLQSLSFSWHPPQEEKENIRIIVDVFVERFRNLMETDKKHLIATSHEVNGNVSRDGKTSLGCTCTVVLSLQKK